MTSKSKKLSDTARALLTAASARDNHLIQPPRLPFAAARQVVRSMLNTGLAEEIPAPIGDADYVWRKADDGADMMLRATPFGLSCLGVGDDNSLIRPTAATLVESGVPPAAAAVDGPQPGLHSIEAPWRAAAVTPAAAEPADAIHVPPMAATRPARQNDLRSAARALLAAWDASPSAGALDEHFADLRAALVGLPATSPPSHPRKPQDTKQAQVLAMLSRLEGASGPQIAEATGWAPHTVRGFLAGLAKKSIKVDVLERVRQVGPNKQGAKGSFTVYRTFGQVEE
jgi:hypothetical protein